MEEGDAFDYWSDLLADLRGPAAAALAGNGLSLPPLSSDGSAGGNDQWTGSPLPSLVSLQLAEGSMALNGEDLPMQGGDNMSGPTELALGAENCTVFGHELALGAENCTVFGHQQWIPRGGGLPDQVGGAEGSQDDQLFDFDSLDFDSLFDDGANQVAVADSSATDQQVQAGADDRWGIDYLLPVAPPAGTNASSEQAQVGADDTPPADPATAPNQPPEPAADVSTALRQEERQMTLADMVRIAEECAEDEAARRVWSGDEHDELLYRLDQYAKHVSDSANRCIVMGFYLHKKTAKDIALRYRWLLDKEKTSEKAELGKPSEKAKLVEKDSAGVKLKKGKGTKGAKKNSNMYPLSKEVLDSKSARELLRDSCIFMQKIEESIKTGELDSDTADCFYYVKINIDAVGKRENEFCRMSTPMPPIDEQGLEEILRKSRHSSSAGEEAA